MFKSPDTTTPLVREPVQPSVINKLGCLEHFIGTWNSARGADATGYNVMPLPQSDAPNGYILKNFPYFEEITFATIAGTAPNRGGDFLQNAYTLFYEQRVFFAKEEAPKGAEPVLDKLIHAENGSWLHLVHEPQPEGPYGPKHVPWPDPHRPQPASTAYVKQVSVPHGNSILATGSALPIKDCKPVFPVADRSQLPFTDTSVEDPNLRLQQQLDCLAKCGITIETGTMLHLTTDRANGGNVSDIRFEQRHATVERFETTWYIEHLSNGCTQLQYSQTIEMKLLIDGKLVPFLHIDANTLQRVN